MSADDGVRCDRHIGEVFPPRCADCDRERIEALEIESPMPGALACSQATTEIIDEALAASGKSVSELADDVAIPLDTLLRQLSGDREFVMSELCAISTALGGDVTAWVQAISERAVAIATLSGAK